MRRWLAGAVMCLGAVAAAAQAPAGPKKGGNPAAATVKNPVPPTAESVSAGRRVYQRLCGKCHGPEGQGDGTAATGAVPADLTDEKFDFGSSDGDLFAVIHDGTSPDMEGYAQRMSDAEIWNVVNFLKSLRTKK
jgi:mono/diheme cytochrome c family protein